MQVGHHHWHSRWSLPGWNSWQQAHIPCDALQGMRQAVQNHGLSWIIAQQRKVMGSSAQNSSGVHWCRRRVRFNEVPEKVPKVPEKVCEALVQSQVTFDRVPEKVPEKVPGFGAEPGQVQQGSGEGSGEGPGGFGAEPGQVQQDLRPFYSRKPSWCFPALRFAARFREICKNKTLRLLGIPPKLIYFLSKICGWKISVSTDDRMASNVQTRIFSDLLSLGTLFHLQWQLLRGYEIRTGHTTIGAWNTTAGYVGTYVYPHIIHAYIYIVYVYVYIYSVCVYVCMYIYIYVYMYYNVSLYTNTVCNIVYMYVCMDGWMHGCTYLRTYVMLCCVVLYYVMLYM